MKMLRKEEISNGFLMVMLIMIQWFTLGLFKLGLPLPVSLIVAILGTEAFAYLLVRRKGRRKHE
ncbi:hypothetical protein [Priestia megaterium]|uniref:hypothetical protein n=1 Tax=Priestia megaterium TaxID=1404 RepID=UPI002E236622|nr:hypothetical protein [Priestia megaterium]